MFFICFIYVFICVVYVFICFYICFYMLLYVLCRFSIGLMYVFISFI